MAFMVLGFWGFEAIELLQGDSGSLVPSSKPGGPVYLSLSGTSLKIFPACVALPAAWLLLA